jgi:hypothetical protein
LILVNASYLRVIARGKLFHLLPHYLSLKLQINFVVLLDIRPNELVLKGIISLRAY